MKNNNNNIVQTFANKLKIITTNFKKPFSKLNKSSKEKPKKSSKKRNILKNQRGYYLEVLSEFKVKNGLFKNLVTRFSTVIILCLFISGTITFLISKNRATSDFKSSTLEILNQNKNYIELLNSTIEGTSTQLYKNKSLDEALKTQVNDYYDITTTTSSILDSYIKPIAGAGTNVKDATILTASGISPTTLQNSPISQDVFNQLKDQEWYKQAIAKNGLSFWMPPHKQMLKADNDGNLIISHVRLLQDIAFGSAPLGVLVLDIDPDLINSKIEDAKVGKNGYIFIVAPDGTIVSHKNSKLIGTKLNSDLFKIVSSNTTGEITNYKDKNTAMYGVYTTSSATGWKLVAMVPQAELSSSATTLGIYTLIVSLICLLFSIIISIITTLKITTPIKDIAESAELLAEGDFTTSCSEDYDIHELKALSKSFNDMIQQLKQILQKAMNLSNETNESALEMLDTSKNMRISSKDINLAIQEIAAGSASQAESTLTYVNISNNFNDEINGAIDSLNKVNSATDQSINLINSSSEIITNLNNSSINNSKAMSQVSDTINTLGENTKDILNILNKINQITKQTNLLSLNASIEAARAGAAGKGFAVVADEIRKLADQSQMASQEISKIIEGVNTSIAHTLDISHKAENAFKEEMNQVSNTISSFGDIKGSINEIVSTVEATIKIINVIDKDKEVMNGHITNIASISEENTASTEEVSASIEEQLASNDTMYNLSVGLSEKSNELKDLVNKFKF